MAARPPQHDAPTKTDGDTSVTRGVGILGGPIFYLILLIVFAVIAGMVFVGLGMG